MTWVLGAVQRGHGGQRAGSQLRAVFLLHREAQWREGLGSGPCDQGVLKNVSSWEAGLGNRSCKGPPQALQNLEVPAGLQGHTVTLSPICAFGGCAPRPLLCLPHK